MDRRLVDVCQAGNIDALIALLEDNPTLLNFIDQTPFTRTPLHLAILAQKTQFAKEIATIKPSFITKVDSFGFSPLHLAAQKGQVELLRFMLEKLQFHSEVTQVVNGRENFTPLHVAAISGQIESAKILLEFCPDWIFDETARNESALHLAVKNGQGGVFVALLEWLELALVTQNKEESWKVPLLRAVHCPCFEDSNLMRIDLMKAVNRLLNLKDEQGNSILHLATMNKQWLMIVALLNLCNSRSGIQLDVNALNSKNLTPLDISMQFPEEKRDAKTEKILIQAGSKPTATRIIPSPPSKIRYKSTLTNDKKPTKSSGFPLEIYVAIFVVATCFLTASSVRNSYVLLGLNMVGFLLSFNILFTASSMGSSSLWKAPLVAVFLGYVYSVFSAIPEANHRMFFGPFFLIFGVGISLLHAKLEWGIRNKYEVEAEDGVPLCYEYA